MLKPTDLEQYDTHAIVEAYKKKVTWNLVSDYFGVRRVEQQISRPRGKGALNGATTFESSSLPDAIAAAESEFRNSGRESADLLTLAKKSIREVGTGYLSPYIRDIVLEKGVSPLDESVCSILKVVPPLSANGSKFSSSIIKFFAVS